jgi:general stress protein 26
MWTVLRPEENAIYFFTDVRAHKDDEIARYPQVCLGFADTNAQKYVSVSGIAEILAEVEKIKELWTISAKAWWRTPNNPDVRLIKVTPQQAEFWDAPGQPHQRFEGCVFAHQGKSAESLGRAPQDEPLGPVYSRDFPPLPILRVNGGSKDLEFVLR